MWKLLLFPCLEITNDLEMIYLIDVSKDTTEEASNEVRDFINKDLPSYNLSPKEKSRIGIVTFAETSNTVLRIRDGDSQEKVQKALFDIQRSKTKNSDLGKAFNFVRNLFGTEGRNFIPKVVVLFTTSNTQKLSADATRSASRLKETATVIVVGLGTRLNKDELEKLATDKDHVNFATQPAELPKLISNVKQAVGEAAGKHCSNFAEFVI